MNKAEFHRRRALRFLDLRNSLEHSVSDEVALGVVNMGTAHLPSGDWSEEIAYVTYDPRVDTPDGFHLHLNPERFDEFTPVQAAGVVWHELNHIIHRHLWGDTTGEMSDKQRLTIAQEIVCNDTVLHHGGQLPMLESLHYGERYLGYNTFPRETKEVYDLLENVSTGEGEHHCGGVRVVDADGNPVDLSSIDRDALSKDIQNILDGLDKIARGSNPGGGRGLDMSGGRGVALESMGLKVGWSSLLRKMNPRIFSAMAGRLGSLEKKTDWRTTPNRFRSVRHTSRMPNVTDAYGQSHFEGKKAPTLVVAVDQSGSIDEETARKSLSVLASLPRNEVDVHACVFATKASEVNLDTGEAGSDIGGGTNFSPIVDFIASRGVPADASVLVFTDGHAEFTNGVPDDLERWWWVNVNEGNGLADILSKNGVITENVVNASDIIAGW